MNSEYNLILISKTEGIKVLRGLVNKINNLLRIKRKNSLNENEKQQSSELVQITTNDLRSIHYSFRYKGEDRSIFISTKISEKLKKDILNILDLENSDLKSSTLNLKNSELQNNVELLLFSIRDWGYSEEIIDYLKTFLESYGEIHEHILDISNYENFVA